MKKLKLMILLLSAAVAGALAAPAAAQPTRKRPVVTRPAPAPRPAPERVKKYDFTGDELEGDIQRPDGTDIQGRRGATFTTLIKVRTHFLPEIAKAAENM